MNYSRRRCAMPSISGLSDCLLSCKKAGWFSCFQLQLVSPLTALVTGWLSLVFGLENVNTITMEGFSTTWLRVPAASFTLHIIQWGIPEGATATAENRKALLHGHICFSISNYDSFLLVIKERGIDTKELTRGDGITVILMSDPDGNTLEILRSEDAQQKA